MINTAANYYHMSPEAYYSSYTPYSLNPISAVSSLEKRNDITGTNPKDDSCKTIKNPTESTVKSAGRKSSPAECETCNSRKYQDGSDENVSFKTSQHIAPEAAASRVLAHEQEHVSNAYTKAAKNNGKVISANVAIHTAVCPECGRSYVSGGTTTTQIKYYNEENPYQKALKSQDAAKLTGRQIDIAC